MGIKKLKKIMTNEIWSFLYFNFYYIEQEVLQLSLSSLTSLSPLSSHIKQKIHDSRY